MHKKKVNNFWNSVWVHSCAAFCVQGSHPLKAVFSIQTPAYVTTLPISNVERVRTGSKIGLRLTQNLFNSSIKSNQ